MENRKKGSKIIVAFFVAILLSLAISTFITSHMWESASIIIALRDMRKQIMLNRAIVLSPIIFFIELHFVVDINTLYTKIFRYRWILGGIVLVFLVINKYNGDSLACYNYIQPNFQTELGEPFIGEERYIRSDEYRVNSPSVLSSGKGENPYGQYTDIARGTKTVNGVYGVSARLGTVAQAPWKLVFLILPLEYAFSFYWYFPIILAFLVTIELFMIISRKNALVSTMGAFLVVSSAFWLWWSFPFIFIAGEASIICTYYLLESKVVWKKILFAIGFSLAFSIFVVNLYPAWQVPLGYLFLVIAIWVIREKWDEIKALNWKQWGIIIISILVSIGLIFSYFFDNIEYIQAIMQTAYPGDRRQSGGFSINKVFYYVQSLFYAYKDVGNASEAGVFFSFFPIPTLVAGYCWIKSKKKDWLVGGLLLISIPMLIYTTVGLPATIANITLLSYSMPERVVDIIGYIQIYFIVILMSRYAKKRKFSIGTASIIAIAVAGSAVFFSKQSYPEYLSGWSLLIMVCIISAGGIVLLSNFKRTISKIFCIGMIIISVITGIYIRPISKGLDTIYEKPVAQQIEKITKKDPDAKWIALGGTGNASFITMCGAKTINFVNFYPNMELWEKLDVNHNYQRIYNRYAHIDIDFVEGVTRFQEVSPDAIRIKLAYSDIEKTEVKYVFSQVPVESNEKIEFSEIYGEDGCWIYEVIYKSQG